MNASTGSHFFIRLRGRVEGPFEWDQLAPMVARGRVSRLHELSKDGKRWQRATEWPGLFDGRDDTSATRPDPGQPATRSEGRPESRAATGSTLRDDHATAQSSPFESADGDDGEIVELTDEQDEMGSSTREATNADVARTATPATDSEGADDFLEFDLLDDVLRDGLTSESPSSASTGGGTSTGHAVREARDVRDAALHALRTDTDRQWYYSIDAEHALGPSPQTELASLIAAGKLAGTNQVWTEGMADWCALRESDLAPLLRFASDAAVSGGGHDRQGSGRAAAMSNSNAAGKASSRSTAGGVSNAAEKPVGHAAANAGAASGSTPAAQSTADGASATSERSTTGAGSRAQGDAMAPAGDTMGNDAVDYRSQATKSAVSLALGVLGLVTPFVGAVFGLFALVVGCFALAGMGPNNRAGRRSAIAGVIIGFVASAVWLTVIVITASHSD